MLDDIMYIYLLVSLLFQPIRQQLKSDEMVLKEQRDMKKMESKVKKILVVEKQV